MADALKDHEKNCQHWRQNTHQSPLCWWHRWLRRRGKRTGNISWASREKLPQPTAWRPMPRKPLGCLTTPVASIQRSKYMDRSLRLSQASSNWWEHKACDTFQDNTDISSIDKLETSLKQQEHVSQFRDTTYALPCGIHLSACLWIMDPQSRAAKKNMSQEDNVLPKDIMHLIQRPRYERVCLHQTPAGSLTLRRPPDYS